MSIAWITVWGIVRWKKKTHCGKYTFQLEKKFWYLQQNLSYYTSQLKPQWNGKIRKTT